MTSIKKIKKDRKKRKKSLSGTRERVTLGEKMRVHAELKGGRRALRAH